MTIDFTKFARTLPYDSELLGIYQPLLGWRSNMTMRQLGEGRVSATGGFTARALSRIAVEVNVTGPPYNFENLAVPVLMERMRVAVSPEIDSVLALVIARQAPKGGTMSNTEWERLLTRDFLQAQLEKTAGWFLTLFAQVPGETPPPDIAAHIHNVLQEAATNAVYDPNEPAPDFGEILKYLINREAAISSYLHWLARNHPALLNGLFFNETISPLADLFTFADPFANFGRDNVDAVLSPVGLVHIFRQYFFEFDTFLGPPVGHIWVPPYTTVELTESSTRKVTTTRTTESESEVSEKRETELRTQDELSDMVKEQNRTNTKFGFSVNFNYNGGTFESGFATNFSLDASRETSREVARKQMRQQTEKVATELRRSLKTTFSVVTEDAVTQGKRYVIKNKTAALVNYELRRKMRQVGVQVQDIGVQLCWQIYVNDPGKEIGLARLIHIAQPADLATIPVPDAPAPLPEKQVETQIQFPWEVLQGGGEPVNYYDGSDREGGVEENDRIRWILRFKAISPGPGYTMQANFAWRSEHTGLLVVDIARIPPPADKIGVPSEEGVIEVRLRQVNFREQSFIPIMVTTNWSPPDQTAALKAYQTELAEVKMEMMRATKVAYTNAVRERVRLASRIRTRPFEDLREEERIMVYRRLIGELAKGGGNMDRHVTTEVIRSIFDVDNMLYFVAPEWWQPREHHFGQSTGDGTILPGSEVSWDRGAESRDNNYRITEDSDPARFGSSLGWLLQLDGDRLRNAFLNSPWVKAVIPIRPGREQAALNWLERGHLEGADGLGATYVAPPEQLLEIKPDGGRVTIRDALGYLAKQVADANEMARTPLPGPLDGTGNVLPTDTVYEHGFAPLQGSFRLDEEPFKVFAQWVEIVPTDQIVAVPYGPTPPPMPESGDGDMTEGDGDTTGDGDGDSPSPTPGA